MSQVMQVLKRGVKYKQKILNTISVQFKLIEGDILTGTKTVLDTVNATGLWRENEGKVKINQNYQKLGTSGLVIEYEHSLNCLAVDVSDVTEAYIVVVNSKTYNIIGKIDYTDEVVFLCNSVK